MSQRKIPTDVDSESQQFLNWAFGQLDDEQFYANLVNEIESQLHQFYSQPREAVLDQLFPKMHRGALEHGAPRHTHEKTQTEIRNEYTDLMGWLLIEKWNEHKGNQS